LCPWVRCSWLALWLGGCSVLIQVDGQQCVNNSDCRQLGLMAGRCVDGACQLVRLCDESGKCAQKVSPQACNETLPCGDAAEVCLKFECANAKEVQNFLCSPEIGPSTATVPFSASVRELVTMKPPKGLSITACDFRDLDCRSPIARTSDGTGTGDLTLDVPWGFLGYFEIRSDETATLLYYIDHQLFGPTQANAIFVTAPTWLEQASALAGAQMGTVSGFVVVQMYDCEERAAPGIHFELDMPGALPFFILNGIPTPGLQTTVYDARLATAMGGFANVNPGVVIVSARLGTKGPRLDWYNVNVRPQTVTQLELRPYPDAAR
jgi:hypothetical protein